MPAETLEVLPEDWTTGLAIVAHPDDLDTAPRAPRHWTAEGKVFTYVLVTSGEPASPSLPRIPGRARSRGARERWVVGVDAVEFLGHPDGVVMADPSSARPRPSHPPAPTGGRGHHQPPRLLGRAQPQHGRPPPCRPRQVDAVRDAANPLALPRAPRRRTRAMERRPLRAHQRVTAADALRRHQRGWSTGSSRSSSTPRTRSRPQQRPRDADPTGPSRPAPRSGCEHAAAFEVIRP